MKDIDFDELDRAVGSVLGTDDKPAKTDGPTTVATATVDPVTSTTALDDSSTSPVDVPEPAKEASDDSLSPAPGIKPSVSPARKRGQFLDMVHPSADMRKTPKIPATTRKTLAPLNTTIATEAPVPKLETVAEVEAPIVDAVTPEPVVPDAAATHEESSSPAPITEESSNEAMPDPLDFAKESAEASVLAQETPPAPAPDSEPVAAEAVQTPFVNDAKVDKRPLGAFAAQEEAGADVLAMKPAQTEDNAPEFNLEVNSVESAGVPQAEEVATGLAGGVTDPEPTPVEEPVVTGDTPAPEPEKTTEIAEPVAAEVSPVEEKPSEVKSEGIKEAPAVSVTVAPADVGQTPSIPQQYKIAEPAKDSDEDNRSLFDTEEYHQPLLTDGKKKPTKIVLIIVMLVVLLALGCALGYIAYNIGI